MSKIYILLNTLFLIYFFSLLVDPIKADGGGGEATPSGSILPSAASTEHTGSEIIFLSDTSAEGIGVLFFWTGLSAVIAGTKMLADKYFPADLIDKSSIKMSPNIIIFNKTSIKRK